REERNLLLVRREQLLVAGAVTRGAAGELARARDRVVEPPEALGHPGPFLRAPARFFAREQRAQLPDRPLVRGGRLGELRLRLVQQGIGRRGPVRDRLRSGG